MKLRLNTKTKDDSMVQMNDFLTFLAAFTGIIAVIIVLAALGI